MTLFTGDYRNVSDDQAIVLNRGLTRLGLKSEPALVDFQDEAIQLVWHLAGFEIFLMIDQVGSVTTNVRTLGRIEEFPLVGGLMEFNARLIAAFTETEFD